MTRVIVAGLLLLFFVAYLTGAVTFGVSACDPASYACVEFQR